MESQIIVGEKVTLRSALGEITRVVTRVQDGIVSVCSDEEYRRAEKEHREPLSVGFRVSDIVDTR